MGDLLFYIGIAIIGTSLIAGFVLFIILWRSRRKLAAKLDAEYGKVQM